MRKMIVLHQIDHSIALLKKHSPCRSSLLYLIGAVALSYPMMLHAQDVGSQTFNDLVGQAIQNPPGPQPTPVSAPSTLSVQALKGARELVPGPSPPPTSPKLFSEPTLGVEYDYRFNQQKTGDRFATDVNEVHSFFSFNLSLTKLQLEYFHLWLDASNDASLTRTGDADVLKIGVTQTISRIEAQDPNKDVTKTILFLVPFFLRKDNVDALTSTGRQISEMDSFTVVPLLIFSVSRAVDKPKAAGDTTPHRTVTLSDKDYTNIELPEVHGWKGQFNLLLRIDYDLTASIGVNGSVTWNHLTNFYSSDFATVPDRNTFALAGGIIYRSKLFEKPLALSATYQYDGFNRDFYQHSLTLVATYTF
jgi:hypothetical protein